MTTTYAGGGMARAQGFPPLLRRRYVLNSDGMSGLIDECGRREYMQLLDEHSCTA